MEPEILNGLEDTEHERRPQIEVESSTAEADKEYGNSERPSESGRTGGGNRRHELPSRADISSGDHHVIVVDHDEEKLCRICHLNAEHSSGSSELMQLGCRCKSDLGVCHPHCAQTWFKYRRSRLCEICGVRAKNVKLVKTFVVDFDDMRPITTAVRPPIMEEDSRVCTHCCFNFLLACLVVGIVIPWLMTKGFL